MGVFKMWRRGLVLGMNARNLRVDRENSAAAIRLVNDKLSTKGALAVAGVPVSGTVAVVRDRGDLERLDWRALPGSWALKPNNGRRGAGILLAADRDGGDAGWRTASGRPLDTASVRAHIRYVLDGEYSMEGASRDSAFFEPLLAPHPALASLVPTGLPDVRIICRGSEPLLAMMRLPTLASEGRANLHQGAVGAAIDLESGRVLRARLGRREILDHPDSGRPIVGARVPEWGEVVEAASACGGATGLGYVGADVVVDGERGPLVLEVNARPGLEIQNITGIGLAGLLEGAEHETSGRPVHRGGLPEPATETAAAR